MKRKSTVNSFIMPQIGVWIDRDEHTARTPQINIMVFRLKTDIFQPDCSQCTERRSPYVHWPRRAMSNGILRQSLLFVGGLMSYLRYLCLFAYSGVQHISSCVFVFFVFPSCVPYVASFSGLSIFHFPFDIL
jgi:hypothetical protein